MSAWAVLRDVFRAMYWVWVASEVLILVLTRTRSRTGEVRDRGSLLLLWLVIVASMAAAGWVGETGGQTMFDGAHWVRWVDLALLACGLAVRWTAIAALGRAFSANVAIRPGQSLYTRGLFSVVRHPSYSGLLLIFLAIGLWSRNWAALVLLVVPTTAALLYRISVEEAALRAAFGGEYERYSRATKRLIPGVY